MKKNIICLALIIILVFETSFTSNAGYNGYSRLLMPTQITKIGNTYFIADANHDQVIYSNDLTTDLTEWKVLTRNVTGPHAIAGDGEVLMVTDTESNRLITFEKTTGGYKQLQIFENIGNRPHYVSYNNDDGCFYALSSMTGEMYIYKRVPGSTQVALQDIKTIPGTENCYIRSFTIANNLILFPVIERSSIMLVDINSFEVLFEYSVPYNLSGMAQISIIGSYFYLTVSTDRMYNDNTSTIVRAKNLEDFSNGNYEDIYELFGGKGTPYFISSFDGSYYMIRENAYPNIYRFNVTNDVISNIKGFF